MAPPEFERTGAATTALGERVCAAEVERLSKLSLERRWDNWRPSRVRVRRPIPAPPSEPTPAELGALQALLDRSTRTATPTIADSVAYPARQMSAAEFVEFWRSVRLVAMATVGPAGQPHIAPVHAELAGTTLGSSSTRRPSGGRTSPPTRAWPSRPGGRTAPSRSSTAERARCQAACRGHGRAKAAGLGAS